MFAAAYDMYYNDAGFGTPTYLRFEMSNISKYQSLDSGFFSYHCRYSWQVAGMSMYPVATPLTWR